jgi:tetratricopeptide (TPR) repeat protein
VRASPAAARRRLRRSTRPQPWQWVLTGSIAVGSVAGGIASNILADLVDKNLGAVTWAAAGLAFVVAGLLTMLELRARRARELEREVEPRPVPAPVPQSGVSTDLPDTVGFVGMQDDVAWLTGAGHAAALTGRRASGTSACVVQAANLIRGEFPGGQLYLDLRARGRPLRPREVVDALCRKAGIGEEALHRAADLDAAAGELRAGLGDRKVLIVLDNVDDPEQVRALLPPPEDCRLLLAGGPALSSLVDAGAAVRGLDQLSTVEAAELFAAAAHDGRSPYRDLRDNEYVAQIVDLAGRQPHAVRVLGSWMAKWEWSPQELVDALRQGLATGRPDATLTLLAARDRAYAALGGGARRLVRLLALVQEPLSRNAVGALIGTNRGHADRLLDEASAGEFIAVFADGRYGLQPLLLDYARIHLLCDEPPRHRVAAMSRLVRYLARQAERYAEAVVPEAPGSEPAGWFARNESLLRKLVCAPWGRPGALPAEPPRAMRRWWLRLSMALCTWYASDDRLDDWAAVCRAVLDSPVAARRAAVAGWAHNELGAVRRWQGDPHSAAVELTAAVKLRHRRGAAQSRTNLGLALLDQGDVDGALDQLQRARRQRSPSDRAGQALTDLALGVAFLARDEPRAARHHLILAANRFEAIGDRRGYAAALTDLALAQWWLGERLDAAHAWNAALDCHPAVNDPKGHAAVLLNAGAIVAEDPRRADLARKLLGESLRQRRLRGRPEGRVLLYLGDVAHAMKDPDGAKRRWAEAVDACDEAGDAEGAAAARGRPATRTAP